MATELLEPRKIKIACLMIRVEKNHNHELYSMQAQ
jgi:hypothetical protein